MVRNPHLTAGFLTWPMLVHEGRGRYIPQASQPRPVPLLNTRRYVVCAPWCCCTRVSPPPPCAPWVIKLQRSSLDVVGYA